MQFLFFLLQPAAVALAAGIPHQQPHNTHHLPATPQLQRRDHMECFDLDAVLNARPYDVYEIVNPTPAQIDQRARAREDFRKDNMKEYGTRPSKIVHGRHPMRDLSKKQIAAARENKRCHEDNDKMSTVFDEEDDLDDVVAPGKRPVLELGFGEFLCADREWIMRADGGDRL
jgi:hypothetical protein